MNAHIDPVGYCYHVSCSQRPRGVACVIGADCNLPSSKVVRFLIPPLSPPFCRLLLIAAQSGPPLPPLIACSLLILHSLKSYDYDFFITFRVQGRKVKKRKLNPPKSTSQLAASRNCRIVWKCISSSTMNPFEGLKWI